MSTFRQMYSDLDTFPIQKGSTFQLKDGRLLGFMEFKTPPDVQSSNPLKIVLLFPGLPGCRFFTHPLLMNDNLTGIHLFVIERPGLGLSTPHHALTFSSFAFDIQEFIQGKGISTFSVIGYSAGGPFALAVSHYLKVEKTAIISSIAPHDAPDCYKGMSWMYKLAWFSVAHAPFLLGWMMRRPLPNLDQLRREFRNESAHEFKNGIIDQDIEMLFCTSEMELLSRQQHSAVLYEYQLWGKAWGFPLEITNCIEIWHGEEDPSTTLSMGLFLSSQLHCRLHRVPGGHFIYFHIFDKVVEFLKT